MRKTAILLILTLAGCSGQDVDRLGRVCLKAAGKFDSLTGGSRGKLAMTWNAVRSSWTDGIDSRVLMRVRWEKTLADLEIEAEVVEPGVVRLKGAVPEEFKQRILDIAQNTQGVEKVVDEMIPPAISAEEPKKEEAKTEGS